MIREKIVFNGTQMGRWCSCRRSWCICRRSWLSAGAAGVAAGAAGVSVGADGVAAGAATCGVEGAEGVGGGDSAPSSC